jgi:SAM-dependent methyltransferase
VSLEDRLRMRDFYDELGELEWDRLFANVRGRVSFEVHRRFLRRFVSAGAHVLEIGAGPGRFTIEIAELGATVDVTDLSEVQLDLHRAHLEGTAAERAVTSRAIVDVCDTSQFDDGAFDAVVAFGGPLSYAFEEQRAALEGLLRITAPGGVVVASVMSLLGAWRYHLRAVVDDTDRAGEDANDLVLATGDLRHFGTPHVCQLFRARDMAELVAACDATLLAMSASNWASLGDPEALEILEGDPDRWARFLDHEVAACAEPGALDGGTHLLFAAARTVRAAAVD